MLVSGERVLLRGVAWNLADLIEHAVDAVPERTALICGDRVEHLRASSRSVRTGSRTTSRRTASAPGDHVGIYALNSIEFVETILAAYKLRAVPINVNYRYVEAELRYLFDNADLVALCTTRSSAPRIAAVRDSLPLLRHLIVIDDGSGADCRRSASVAYERRARRPRRRARLRPALRRRHLHPLHRRHHRHAEGRGVAARRRVPRARRRHRLRHRRVDRATSTQFGRGRSTDEPARSAS